MNKSKGVQEYVPNSNIKGFKCKELRNKSSGFPRWKYNPQSNMFEEEYNENEVELSQDPDEYRKDDIDKEINCRDDGQNLVLHHMLTTPEMINDNK